MLDFGGVIPRTLFETRDPTERALALAAGTLTWRGPFAPDTDAFGHGCRRTELANATTGLRGYAIPPRWAANTAWVDLWPEAFAMRGKLAREC